ncbi:MAG: preprotein translocase subunit SecE [Pseudomonadota bacterium]
MLKSPASFIRDIKKEIILINWIKKKEVTSTTLLVLFVVIIAALFFIVIDWLSYEVIGILLNLGNLL